MTMRPRLLGSIAALIAAIAALHAIGVWAELTIDEWSMWTGETIPAVTGALRLVALALSYYLVIVIVAVALLGERVAGHRLERLLPYAMLVALGLVAGTGALSTLTTNDDSSVIARSPAPLTLEPTGAPLTLDPANDPSPTEPTPAITTWAPPETLTQADDVWIVRSGESFWSIAQETLEDAWGADNLADADIASYWRRLIAANEDRLVDPGNPDLLLPDQELILPTPPNAVSPTTAP